MKPPVALREVVARFDQLAARWQDEGEYEDFEEYRDAMARFLEQRGMVMLQMSHHPWTLVFSFNRLEHRLELVGDVIKLKVKSVMH